ncbi:unnamed protein product [Pedinophyceae sp. YPF-701]|nr:unnamed protein product [Pedinophyceae sp. YPF-701]
MEFNLPRSAFNGPGGESGLLLLQALQSLPSFSSSDTSVQLLAFVGVFTPVGRRRAEALELSEAATDLAGGHGRQLQQVSIETGSSAVIGVTGGAVRQGSQAFLASLLTAINSGQLAQALAARGVPGASIFVRSSGVASSAAAVVLPQAPEVTQREAVPDLAAGTFKAALVPSSGTQTVYDAGTGAVRQLPLLVNQAKWVLGSEAFEVKIFSAVGTGGTVTTAATAVQAGLVTSGCSVTAVTVDSVGAFVVRVAVDPALGASGPETARLSAPAGLISATSAEGTPLRSDAIAGVEVVAKRTRPTVAVTRLKPFFYAGVDDFVEVRFTFPGGFAVSPEGGWESKLVLTNANRAQVIWSLSSQLLVVRVTAVTTGVVRVAVPAESFSDVFGNTNPQGAVAETTWRQKTVSKEESEQAFTAIATTTVAVGVTATVGGVAATSAASAVSGTVATQVAGMAAAQGASAAAGGAAGGAGGAVGGGGGAGSSGAGVGSAGAVIMFSAMGMMNKFQNPESESIPPMVEGFTAAVEFIDFQPIDILGAEDKRKEAENPELDDPTATVETTGGASARRALSVQLGTAVAYGSTARSHALRLRASSHLARKLRREPHGPHAAEVAAVCEFYPADAMARLDPTGRLCEVAAKGRGGGARQGWIGHARDGLGQIVRSTTGALAKLPARCAGGMRDASSAHGAACAAATAVASALGHDANAAATALRWNGIGRGLAQAQGNVAGTLTGTNITAGAGLLDSTSASDSSIEWMWLTVGQKLIWLAIAVGAITFLQVFFLVLAWSVKKYRKKRFPRPAPLLFPRLQIYLIYFWVPALGETIGSLISSGDPGGVAVAVLFILFVPLPMTLFMIWMVFCTQTSLESPNRGVYYEVDEQEADAAAKRKLGPWQGFGIGRRVIEGEWKANSQFTWMVFRRFGMPFEDYFGPMVVRRHCTWELDPIVKRYQRGYLEEYLPRHWSVLPRWMVRFLVHITSFNGPIRLIIIFFIALVSAVTSGDEGQGAVIGLCSLFIFNVILLLVFQPYAAIQDQLVDAISAVFEATAVTLLLSIILVGKTVDDAEERAEATENLGLAMMVFMGLVVMASMVAQARDAIWAVIDTVDAMKEAYKKKDELTDIEQAALKAIKSSDITVKKYANRWVYKVHKKPIRNWPVLHEVTAAERAYMLYKVALLRASDPRYQNVDQQKLFVKLWRNAYLGESIGKLSFRSLYEHLRNKILKRSLPEPTFEEAAGKAQEGALGRSDQALISRAQAEMIFRQLQAVRQSTDFRRVRRQSFGEDSSEEGGGEGGGEAQEESTLHTATEAGASEARVSGLQAQVNQGIGWADSGHP